MAGIVAANLFATDDLLYLLCGACSRHASLFQFAALLALEGLFQVIYRCGHTPRRTVAVAVSADLRSGGIT